mgnify:FL=1
MDSAKITIQDLASIQNVIETACSRGAFKASEMKSIGELYEKLSAFLQAVKTQAETDATQQTQGE